MAGPWTNLATNDLLGAALSVGLLAGYHAYLYARLRRDPLHTIQAVNALARAAWVESIMASGGRDILAIQTLRNAIMGPTFLASTAILLIIGTLTLSGQQERLSETWHTVNVLGTKSPELWLVKLLILLLDFFVAFFSFSMAIRLFIHVGFMINVPRAMAKPAIAPPYVARLLNQAGLYHTLGMRAYYFSVPLVFWLFGPHLMVLATLLLLVVLYYNDRAPHFVDHSG